jgi:hypothetical protein
MKKAPKPGFRLDLRDLRPVHTIVESGTLGQAAGRLHFTSPDGPVRLTPRDLHRQWLAATRAQVATPDYVKAFVALLARDLHGGLAPNARKLA